MPINAAHGNFREPASDDWDIERRLTGPEYGPADGENEFSLRPRNFDEYVGQDAVKENLSVFIAAARERGDCLDHVLLHGPPGLGKTTLSCIIASELGVNLKITSGPAIEKAGDLAALLTTLNRNDVLFIDEIHRLPRAVEEVLYPAMEDYAIDIMIGKGPAAKSLRIDLPKFTLIGATTRVGMLSAPLRDRFGMVHHLEFYKIEELAQIVERSAKTLNVEIDEEGALEIARRSRGTPRLANRLLKRSRDFAEVVFDGRITKEIACHALDALKVDPSGLDTMDRRLLLALLDTFGGGPAGLETLAASIGEDVATVEDVCEPYLMQQGFLQRTPRGRMVTSKCLAYFHRSAPQQGEQLRVKAE